MAGGQKEIKLVYPTEGSYLVEVRMCSSSRAPRTSMAAAKTLYDALMSKDVQEAELVKNFRRPTRSDIAVSKAHYTLPDLKSIKIFPLDQAQLLAMNTSSWWPRGPSWKRDELKPSLPHSHLILWGEAEGAGRSQKGMAGTKMATPTPGSAVARMTRPALLLTVVACLLGTAGRRPRAGLAAGGRRHAAGRWRTPRAMCAE